MEQAEGHIIYIGNEFEKKQFIANWFRNNASLKGSEGASLDDQLLVVNDNYFPKTKGNAFHNADLVSFIQNNSINEIAIAGVFAEGCVSATAKGAKKINLFVTVIEDAIAGATDGKRDKAIQKLRSSGVSVIKSSNLTF